MSIAIVGLMLINGCNSLPQLYQSVEDISTDEAVQATVYKNAMLKDTDIKVQIDVINKDAK